MSEPGGDMLAFEHVSLAYSDSTDALRDVSFTIRHGEAIALCGANGSGKTTLLKVATGLLTPSEGTVHLAGTPLDSRARKQAFRTIGFLFQDSDDQLFCTTVREDIAYGPTNMGLGKDEIAERVQQSLEMMKIAHLADRPIHHLSGGEKRRAALAGLLAMRTPIIVMDEPTSGLDPTGASSLLATLKMLNREYGHTLIMATHEMDRIPEFATRVMVLKDGGLFRDGTPHEVLTDIPALQETGLQPPILARYFYWKNQQDGGDQCIPLTLAEAMQLP